MITDDISVLYPFMLSWNLRNLISAKSILTSNQPGIVGTCPGKYPIDAWKTFFLEIPKDGNKKDITGRFLTAFCEGIKNTEWDHNRTVSLPIYSIFPDYDIEKLKIVFKHWDDIGISNDVPCLALAVKCRGLYCDNREGQYVSIMAVWNDAVARIISLDWFEGPLEDCTTPEWYLETTPLLNLRDAIIRMRDIYKNTFWDNISFSIFTIPTCLGSCLNGELANPSYDIWEREWRYTNYSKLRSDLITLFIKISDIFFQNPVESDVNE